MTTTTQTKTRPLGWLRGFARAVFAGQTLQAATISPVILCAAIVGVGAALLSLATATSLTHLWQLPVITAVVLILGWAAQVREAIRREEDVHPVAKALAFPVLAFSVLAGVLLFAVSFGDIVLGEGS